MKENVFIGWSGNRELAIKIKEKLDEKGCLCIVGGNYNKNPGNIQIQGTERGAINKTVRNQMDYCNQAIVLLQKKKETMQISGNLWYELGYLTAKNDSSKIHIFYIDMDSTADKAIPSDIHGSWGNLVSTTDKTNDQIADEIVKFFLQNINADLQEEKIQKINNHRHIEYALDVHLERPLFSHYDLAKQLIFYVQAAFIYQESKISSQKCEELRHSLIKGLIKSEELMVVLEYARLTFEVFDMAIPSAKDGRTSLKGAEFRKILREYKALMSLLLNKKRDEHFRFSTIRIDSKDIQSKQDEFINWMIAQAQQHITYLFMTYFNSAELDVEGKDFDDLLKEAVEFGVSAVRNLEILGEDPTNAEYARLLLGYVYRNLSVFSNLLQKTEEGIEYQRKSYELRKYLYVEATHGTLWNVDLKNYIALEYFLQRVENVKNIEDSFERMDAISEIREYIRETQKYEESKMLMFSNLVKTFTLVEKEV